MIKLSFSTEFIPCICRELVGFLTNFDPWYSKGEICLPADPPVLPQTAMIFPAGDAFSGGFVRFWGSVPQVFGRRDR